MRRLCIWNFLWNFLLGPFYSEHRSWDEPAHTFHDPIPLPLSLPHGLPLSFACIVCSDCWLGMTVPVLSLWPVRLLACSTSETWFGCLRNIIHSFVTGFSRFSSSGGACTFLPCHLEAVLIDHMSLNVLQASCAELRFFVAVHMPIYTSGPSHTLPS